MCFEGKKIPFPLARYRDCVTVVLLRALLSHDVGISLLLSATLPLGKSSPLSLPVTHLLPAVEEAVITITWLN
jgi:hypothetical protein